MSTELPIDWICKTLPEEVVKVLEKRTAKLTKAEKEKIFADAMNSYLNSQIAPGESVGLVTAQSIGEPGTQMTLRTHHFVGVAELNVTLGLPRIIEVFDARKTPKTPSMTIYLKPPHNKSRLSAEIFARKIKQVTLEELAKELAINFADQSIAITLESGELTAHGVKPEQIAESLKKQFKVDVEQSGLTLKIKSAEKDTRKLYRFKERLKSAVIGGIKNITDVLPVYRKYLAEDVVKKFGEDFLKNLTYIKETDEYSEYVVQTFGSNLKEILMLEEVDPTRTTTNDIIEISKTLGIEAAREAIVNEVLYVLEEQGISVDPRHVYLVADLMCFSGEVSGITRHGIASQKTSVLARASFEIPIAHLVNASLIGETDKLTSVVENVLINQMIPIGTGLPGLYVKMMREKE
ncbi:MAG: DNA-directed RNA polymerase subunit A'' [Candidatus Nanoarchaeia archaeon]